MAFQFSVRKERRFNRWKIKLPNRWKAALYRIFDNVLGALSAGPVYHCRLIMFFQLANSSGVRPYRSQASFSVIKPASTPNTTCAFRCITQRFVARGGKSWTVIMLPSGPMTVGLVFISDECRPSLCMAWLTIIFIRVVNLTTFITRKSLRNSGSSRSSACHHHLSFVVGSNTIKQISRVSVLASYQCRLMAERGGPRPCSFADGNRALAPVRTQTGENRDAIRRGNAEPRAHPAPLAGPDWGARRIPARRHRPES